MTSTKLIEIAASHFQQGARHKQILDAPQVHDAAIIYFRVQPQGNCVAVVDKSSGEVIHSQWSVRDALLPEYGPHIWLPQEARALVEESQRGVWDRFPENGTQPTICHAEMLRALAQRCPGFTAPDYDRALAEAFQKVDKKG